MNSTPLHPAPSGNPAYQVVSASGLPDARPIQPAVIASYNLLADAHLLPERYPDSPPEWMDPSRRVAALAEETAALDADIICLQETEARAFAVLAEHLGPLGYLGLLELRSGGEQEGCAMFYRSSSIRLNWTRRLDYAELPATEPCHRLAQLALFSHGERPLLVANTHLQWDPPATAPSACRGLAQVTQLADELEPHRPNADVILCGDLNAGADSGVIRALSARGFRSTHEGNAAGPTCRANGRLRMIDFIMFDHGLRATPRPLPSLDPGTPMPGPGHPSDHIPVVASLEMLWKRKEGQPTGGKSGA